MPALHPAARRLNHLDRVVLWNPATGRHAALSTETAAMLELGADGALAPVWARLRTLGLTDDGPDVALSHKVVCRSRLVLLIVGDMVLWHPIPAQRTPGGFAYAAMPLTAQECALWRAANGARTVADVAAAADCSITTALGFFARLTDPAVQGLQLRDRPPHPRDLGLCRLVALPRPAAARPADQLGAGGQTTLGHYHAEIDDAESHFDDTEITVAHAFAIPHAALHGQVYGAQLHRALESRGMLPNVGSVLEIGPGDGELGAAFWQRAVATGTPAGPGLRLDASPSLLELQARRQPDTTSILGDATDLPLPDNSIGLVICNEVMADLTAARFDPDQPLSDSVSRAVMDRVARYGLVLPPGIGWANLGAWQLVEQVARVLQPGGAAFLSEFGGLDEVPTETTQLDHPEVSIHFGHLLRVARGCGLDGEVVSLTDFLSADLQARWLARHSFDAVRAAMAARGGHLAARAWTIETLPVPFVVEGLDEVAVTADGPGPVITRFAALILRKPK